jgi:hypothetical protein
MQLDNPSINLRTIWNSSDKNTKNLPEMLTATMQFLGATSLIYCGTSVKEIKAL